jgi:hypothetical protein
MIERGEKIDSTRIVTDPYRRLCEIRTGIMVPVSDAE